MKASNFFRYQEMFLMVVMAILGIVSIIGGIVEGKPHCFIVAAIALGLAALWLVDDRQKRKEYGRE